MDREKIIEEFEHLLYSAKGNYQDFVDLTVEGGEEILALLKEQEAVVRCDDCKYGFCINPDEKEKIYECMKYPIFNLRITHKPEWFCADGVTKEDVNDETDVR